MDLGTWTITEPFSACSGWGGHIAIFNRDANNIQVAYSDQNTYKRIVRVSTDGAVSWGTEKLNWEDNNCTYNQSIWSDSSYIYTVATKFIDLGVGHYLNELTLSVSTDNGSTFSDKVIYSDEWWMNATMEVYIVGNTRYIYVLFLTEGDAWYGAKLKLAISSNNGDSWTIKDVGPFYDNALQTQTAIDLVIIDTNTIYACTYRQNDYTNHVFYKSINGGDNWSLVQLPYMAGDDYDAVSMVCKDADNIYVLIQNNYSGTKGIYFAKSIDAGASWNKTRLTTQFVNAYPVMQFYNNTIFFAYIDYDTKYLTLKYSEDYGGNWNTVIVDNTETLGNYVNLSVNSSMIYIFYTDTSDNGKIAKCSLSLPISSILMYKFRPVVLV
jgi:hypothetical protein